MSNGSLDSADIEASSNFSIRAAAEAMKKELMEKKQMVEMMKEKDLF